MKELFVCRAYRPRAWVAAAFSSRTPVRTLKFRIRLLSVSSSSSDETLPIPLSRSSLSLSESAGSNAVPSSKLQEANASGTTRDKYFTTQRQEEKSTQQFRVFHSKQNHCQPFRLIPTSSKTQGWFKNRYMQKHKLFLFSKITESEYNKIRKKK